MRLVDKKPGSPAPAHATEVSDGPARLCLRRCAAFTVVVGGGDGHTAGIGTAAGFVFENDALHIEMRHRSARSD